MLFVKRNESVVLVSGQQMRIWKMSPGFFLQHHENTRGGKIMSHKTWRLGALHCVLLIATVF